MKQSRQDLADKRHRKNAAGTPQVSPFLLGGFHWYSQRLIRKSFNSVRMAKACQPELDPSQPIVCFVNHPGWWDPLFVFLLNRLCFQERTVYIPIDLRSLAKYPVFQRLGFYGIELSTTEGARSFLRVTRELLQRDNTAIWITPSGRFDDVRQRTRIQPGLPHLAATTEDAQLVPVAFEYTFWEERTPEALVQFGDPIRPAEHRLPKTGWTSFLEEQLADVQRRLAEKAIERDYQAFETLLDGSAGVGGPYDVVRRAKAFVQGQGFDARHRQTRRAA